MMDSTPQDNDPQGTNKLISLLGEQYKPLEKVMKETFDFLGDECSTSDLIGQI